MAGFWADPLMNTAVDAAADDCGYVSGWYTDFDSVFDEATSREAVTWAAADEGAAAASNQPVLTVAGACTIVMIVLAPGSTSEFGESSASHILDDPVVFTEAGTYTLTSMSLGLTNP